MIILKNLTKSYKRYHVSFHSLKSFVLHFRQYKRQVNKIDILHAVKNLNLIIDSGEVLCITGPNGAGKSTLAKLIAGTVTPTSGSIEVTGKIVPFLELGIAFNTELTGSDNLYLNGVLLGLSLNYLKKNKDKIFQFAELEDFVDTPLKYYSSGMRLRLGFAIAMHAEGDVYIFDEILAVGDESFQNKCFAAFNNLVKQKKTIIIVTHSMQVIKKHATQLLVLANDKHTLIRDIGSLAKVEHIQDLMKYLKTSEPEA